VNYSHTTYHKKYYYKDENSLYNSSIYKDNNNFDAYLNITIKDALLLDDDTIYIIKKTKKINID
jgi:hypothetical protein